MRKNTNAHISLWRACRGLAPSSPSTSKSGLPSRRRRGAAPDLPAANHKPCTDHGIHQSAACPSRQAAIAPAPLPPSSYRRRRKRRADAGEEVDQKSRTKPPLHRRPCLDRRTPRPHDIPDDDAESRSPEKPNRSGGGDGRTPLRNLNN